MALADDVSDKLTCINTIIGFVLGIILAIFHNNADIWITAINFVIVFSLVLSIFPIGAGLYSRYKLGQEFSLMRVFPIYLLILAEMIIGAVLGIILGSVLIGNFHVEKLNLR